MFSNYLSRDFLRTLKDCGITSGLIDWWVYVCSCAVSHHFPDSQFCPLSVFANHASFFHRSLRIIFSGHADSSCLLFPFGFDSSFVMVVHVIYGKWKGMKYHNCSSVGQISVDNFLHLGWQQSRVEPESWVMTQRLDSFVNSWWLMIDLSHLWMTQVTTHWQVI